MPNFISGGDDSAGGVGHNGAQASCKERRLAKGLDVLIESREGRTLCHCVGAFGPQNIHAGKWIVWDDDLNKLVAIGSEEWARKHMPLEITNA